MSSDSTTEPEDSTDNGNPSIPHQPVLAEERSEDEDDDWDPEEDFLANEGGVRLTPATHPWFFDRDKRLPDATYTSVDGVIDWTGEGDSESTRRLELEKKKYLEDHPAESGLGLKF